jgi:hypothetical protein
LQIDCYGDRTVPVVEQLVASERLHREVGQIAVPPGLCTEPSNVKARGHGCAYRYRWTGCEHFRTDASNQAELREYLHPLLAGRERLAAAVRQLAEWARAEATPSDDEIAAVRPLIRRNEQIIDKLDIDELSVSLRCTTAPPQGRPRHRQRRAVTTPPGPRLQHVVG